MKRIFLGLAAVVFVVILLCGCADGINGLRINQITKVEVINLISDARVEIDQSNEKFETIVTLINECQKSFMRTGDCQPEDGSQYQLTIYTGESVALNLIINTDGSFCIGRSRYVLTEDADIDVILYLSMFRRMTTVDMPYLVEEPEQLSEPVILVEDNGWNFICQQVMLDGARYTVLAREDCFGQYQVVWEIREPYGNRVVISIEYVEKSRAASDGAMLYFSIHNTDSGWSRLLGFSTQDNGIVLAPVEPCSNLLIIDHGNNNYDGWLVCGDRIVSIDLASGEMIEDRVSTVISLGGLPEIDGALFHDPQNASAIRYVRLAEGDRKGTIDIRVWQSEHDNIPQIIHTYTYDCDSLQLVTTE